MKKRFRQRAFRNRFTINNPFLTDDIKVLNPENLTDEQKSLLGTVKHDYSYLKQPQFKDYFVFALVEYDLKDNNEIVGKAVCERAFFKDYLSACEYFKQIDFIDYVCFQYEQGAAGNKHLQGFMHYIRQIDFTQVKNIFPTIHLDSCFETSSYYIEYCRKQDTRIEGYEFFSHGLEPADERERTDLTAFTQDVKNKLSKIELFEKYPNIMLNRLANVTAMQQEYLKAEFMSKPRELHITYIYGKEGAGKTTYVERVLGYPPIEVCVVGEYNTTGMFDEYNGHDIIVFDEFDSQIEITKMNKWLDGRPLALPARQSNRVACYTKVFICSNYPLDSLYKKARAGIGAESKEPSFRGFLRRIDEVIYMPERNVYIWQKGEPTAKVIETLTSQGAKYTLKPQQSEQMKLIPVDDGDLPF